MALDEQRLAHIQKDVSYATAGSEAALDRIFTHHLPFLFSELRRLEALAFPEELLLQGEVAEVEAQLPQATAAAVVFAHDHDLDVFQVEGTGANGKITIRDVRNFLAESADEEEAEEVEDEPDEDPRDVSDSADDNAEEGD